MRTIAAALLVMIGGAASWWSLAPETVPRPHARMAATAAPLDVRAPVIAPRTADEATILADDPPDVTVFQFVQNPAIIVLDFPSLARQGRMLNRIAVLIEKAGAPHDRLLGDAELDRMIRAGGDTPATFYLGHDYRSTEILRFFALADRDRVALNAEEAWLRALVARLGWTEDGPAGALISIPRADADVGIDVTLRRAILRHELSHGEYFTNPAYTAFARHFWADTMTRDDRAKFTAFLAHDHYDSSLVDLMENESIAYLIHTPDPRFFSAAIVGVAPRHIADLRAAFYRAMPAGWLRDDTLAPLPEPPVAPTPRGAPRRGIRAQIRRPERQTSARTVSRPPGLDRRRRRRHLGA